MIPVSAVAQLLGLVLALVATAAIWGWPGPVLVVGIVLYLLGNELASSAPAAGRPPQPPQ